MGVPTPHLICMVYTYHICLCSNECANTTSIFFWFIHTIYVYVGMSVPTPHVIFWFIHTIYVYVGMSVPTPHVIFFMSTTYVYVGMSVLTPHLIFLVYAYHICLCRNECANTTSNYSGLYIPHMFM